MKNDNTKYLEEAAKKFNGETATKTGPDTLKNEDLKDLDDPRVGTKFGLLKKGSR